MTNLSSGSDLHTLTYRVDANSLGEATAYRLDERFGAAWARLEEHARLNRGNPDTRPAYSSLAAALRAVTGQPVQLFPRQGDGSSTLLVTSVPIDTWLLETAFRTFERLSLAPRLTVWRLRCVGSRRRRCCWPTARTRPAGPSAPTAGSLRSRVGR